MKHYFLGAAANYTREKRLAHTFAVGRERDCRELEEFLAKKYEGEAILCKNGRSALALALRAYFKPGDAILVNGFTCYAVYEAVKAAGMKPVWVDIEKDDLNFSIRALTNAMKGANAELANSRSASLAPVVTGLARYAAPVVAHDLESANSRIRGIIIQNTLGNPVDIVAIEKFAKEHDLTIIEDLAHSVGVKYADGREAGMVGAATALSFGKDKAIDTISGGAVILRDPCKSGIKAPMKTPKPSDHLRARFYPLFGAIYRALSYVHLNGAFMRFLLAIHFVERSADNKLDLERKISKFEAKLALKQLKRLKQLKKSGEPPLREFYLVKDREEVLKKLATAGYYFRGFWYEKPVSPERYYKKTHFPEENCPNAVYVSEHIVNLPTYYGKRELARARKIIEEHLEEEHE